MRAVLLTVIAAMVAAQVPAQPAAPETRRPIIVDALSPHAPPAAIPAVPAAPVHAGHKDHKQPEHREAHHAELTQLEDVIKKHQDNLETISKQLEEGLQQKKRLVVAQKLLEAIIHLKKAERLLHALDARVESAKAAIKKFGDDAEEITASIKASEVAHKKELADLNQKMEDIRAGLSSQEATLATLVAKRSRIATTVGKWQDHVATLHDVHEALSSHHHTHRATVDDFPEPPSTSGVLNEIGVTHTPSSAASAAAATGEDEKPSAVAALTASAAGAAPSLADAAASEVVKATFTEIGQKPAGAASRFAEAEAAAAAEVAAANRALGDDDEGTQPSEPETEWANEFVQLDQERPARRM